MKVTLQGDKELQRIFKKASRKFPQETQKAIKNQTEKGKELSAKTTPYDTGFLRGSQMTKYPSAFEGWIVSSAGYSGYVNFGTRFNYAQPWFTQMWIETERKAKEELKKVLRGSFE